MDFSKVKTLGDLRTLGEEYKRLLPGKYKLRSLDSCCKPGVEEAGCEGEPDLRAEARSRKEEAAAERSRLERNWGRPPTRDPGPGAGGCGHCLPG